MTDIITHNSNINIEKDSLSELREAIQNQYCLEDRGDQKLGTASKAPYEDLAKKIEDKIKRNSVQFIVVSSANTKSTSVLSPQPAFLRNLFYVKKDAQSMNSRRYNFDQCYYYAFGCTQADHFNKKANVLAPTPKIVFGQIPEIIISALKADVIIAEKIKAYTIEVFPSNAYINFLDLKHYTKGTLRSLYEKTEKSFISIVVLSNNCLQNVSFIKSIMEIEKEIPDKFHGYTILIASDEMCEGENDLDGLGKFKMIEFWTKRIAYFKDTILPLHTVRSKNKISLPDYILKANEEIIEASEILRHAFSFVNFILHKDATFLPLGIFLNQFNNEAFNDFINKKKQEIDKASWSGESF